VQTHLLQTQEETPTAERGTFAKSELVGDAAVEQMQALVESELSRLGGIQVRVVGEVGDVNSYSYAMSLNAKPGEENPVWTGACRVLEGQDAKVLELYVNDDDYIKSDAEDKKEQMEKFLVSCLVAQDPEFEQLERDAATSKLDSLYQTLQDKGLQLVEAGEAGI